MSIDTPHSLTRATSLALAALLCASCNPDDNGDTTPTTDVGNQADVGMETDATMQMDAGTDSDAGTESDTGNEPDATTNPVVVVGEPTISTSEYRTGDQMLLANELNESGEPFAEALGYDLDLLDPMVPGSPDDTAYVTGIEGYEFSRYQLGTVISRSGIGLHMMWAPLVSSAAAMQPADFDGSMTGTPNGFKEDDQLIKTIKMFSTLANQPPPGNPWPQFAEFASADPHLPQAVDADNFAWADFSTLRWDRSTMNKTLNPAAMGQALMKQYLWAQDMLSAYHDADGNEVDPAGAVSPDFPGSPDFDPDNGVFFGGDPVDGFVGMVLTAEAINKVAFLKGALAYDGTTLRPIDLGTYDPANGVQYFPHGIEITEAPVAAGLPPRVDSLTVTDPSSDLFDQASMLWGTASFTNMMNPDDTSDGHAAYHEVFDGSPFPRSMSQSGEPGPYDLMKGTSKAIVMNLMAMHYDADNAVFVDSSRITGGAVVRDPEVSTVASAYLIVALEVFIGEFTGTPLETMARTAVSEQANFLISNLSDGNGVYVDAFTLGGPNDASNRDVASQAAAVHALYTAYRVTGEQSILDAATAAYQALIEDYYLADYDNFRTSVDGDSITHTPRTFALLTGALRDASLDGGQADAAGIYTAFFKRVGEGMQLAEGANTGETGGDSDGDGIPFIPEQAEGLPPVFAGQAVYPLTLE